MSETRIRKIAEGQLNSKLTAEQVKEIKTLLKEGKKGRDLALQFNVKPSQISNIKKEFLTNIESQGTKAITIVDEKHLIKSNLRRVIDEKTLVQSNLKRFLEDTKEIKISKKYSTSQVSLVKGTRDIQSLLEALDIF
jgi:DNA-binding NarL/FixJ family response regulator